MCSGEMRRYMEEYQWRRRPPGLTLTLSAKAWGANRIRYPGSPRRKRCLLAVGELDSLVAQLTH